MPRSRLGRYRMAKACSSGRRRQSSSCSWAGSAAARAARRRSRDPVGAREPAHRSRTGFASGAAQVGPRAVEPLVLGKELRPGALEARRGSARACRASGRGRSPRSRRRPPRGRRATTAASCSGRSESPGRIGAIPTEAWMPASTSRESARSRWRGGAVPGSVLPPDLLVERRHRERDRDLGPARGLGEDVDVAHDHRPARDQPERVRGVARAPRCRRASAGSGPRPAGTDRSPRRSRRSRRATRAAPARGRRTSATFALTRIERAVARVGRPVGPQLEGPHVTERAAVDAAHVRVQRPGERHAPTRG